MALLWLWLSWVNTVQAEPSQLLRVGVLANWGHQYVNQRWQPLMEHLSERVEGVHFEIQSGTFDELQHALANDQISFIITNPGQYLYLSKRFPLSWLATMRSQRHNHTTNAIGAAILVRADSPYRTLYDLQGKSVVASGFHALGGYQAALGLIKQRGIEEPQKFFDNVRFLGFPLDPLIYNVRDGTADAAITAFCTLEDMVAAGKVRLDDYRVINRSQPPGYDCQTSTELYPNWSFAAIDSVATPIREQLTQALLALTPDDPVSISSGNAGWTSPISQLAVIKLFSDLEFEHRQTSAPSSLMRWLDENQHWAIGALLLWLIATLYHFWIEYKVRRQSEELINSERQLQQQTIQLEKLHSTAVLGEIGSGLAHELNQPLAAISNYCEGGQIRLQLVDNPDPQQLDLLDKIATQTQRASAVVNRIRGLLKRHKTVIERTNMLTVLEDSLALLEVEFQRNQIEIEQRYIGEPFFVMADKVAMQQVLVNVLKNAVDAMRPDAQGTITIVQHFEESQLRITIADTGPGFSDDPDKMMDSFITTKEDGLGLGLAICRELISQQQGTFTVVNLDDDTVESHRGCEVAITLLRAAVSAQ
ncbi:sensor histidine kinase [Ferrimonas lipolytica]|uniref:histidine kinase n=1 Tax=Ferrimonas lipolytica TaxID=2724191 RepID=A0A6H1UG80_9GAMM|nr:PhnD/SsuA/transferrin family substrate-binding protein [Ferrimonas lipolytica]QIZ77610.1 PhnD/SsuA/transferrin family substrate-binding protein [Ferrimonas lipolytica]